MDSLLIIGNAKMWKTHNKDKPLGQVVSYERYGRGFWLQVHGPRRRYAKVTTLENTTIYHEIDFLLPAQRFNINFSYITEKGLPFVREFVLRLIHLAPMSMSQVATFFGFSRKEVQEAIDDLERDELTLSENGRLTLTEKSRSYFTELGEVPRLSLLRDSTACLSFDLATFSCLRKDKFSDKWKAGISIKVDDENASCSQTHVKAFPASVP
jgi:hypothetical protein